MGIVRTSSRYAARRPKRRASKTTAAIRRPGRYASRSSIVVVPRGVRFAFPEEMVTTLRYCDNITLSTTLTPVGNLFRMNSLYDPDYTGVGHQPMYFDQLTAVYSRFSVLNSKIKVTFTAISHDTDVANKGPFQVGIAANTSGVFPSTISTLQEQNRTVMATMGRDKAGNNVKTLMLDYIPNRDLGIPASEDSQCGSSGANPTLTYYSYPYCADIAGTTSSVLLNIEIEFRCKFSQQGNSVAS